MRTYLDCLPCMVRQAIDSARRLTDSPTIHEQIVRTTLTVAARMSFDDPPPAMGRLIHRRLRELTGERDPYRLAKEAANAFALQLYPDLKQRIAGAKDPFTCAVKLAIVGNVIDLGVKSDLTDSEISAAIGEGFEATLDNGAVEDLKLAVRAARDILYLADNAGEIVFDRLLIEQMPLEKVTLVVKGGPIINDATREDAEAAGLTDLVQVIDNGSDAPGTILELCSGVFRERFKAADLIIVKGQGNFETLNESRAPNLFFLLKAKCGVIAQDLGCPVGSLVLRRSAYSATARPGRGADLAIAQVPAPDSEEAVNQTFGTVQTDNRDKLEARA